MRLVAYGETGKGGVVTAVKLSWTQPLCGRCWYERDDREPNRLVGDYRAKEKCCYCGKPTFSGIYKRVDPATVPYPAVKDD